MFRRQKEEWRLPIWPEIERYLWWIAFTIVLAWAFAQLYALSLYVGVVWVNNEAWRLPGWYPFTIGALTRFVGFILGTIWLGLMVWSERNLDVALQKGKLRARAFRLIGYALATGVFAVIVLAILPLFWDIPS
ncbi:MAG: hypothetical protein ACI9EW_000447 [Cellvibrionaceae bacterium]|jgi:hypothetical protein